MVLVSNIEKQNQQTVQNVIVEAHSNLFDDNYSIPEPEAHLPSDNDYLSDNNFASENEVATHSKHKQKNDKIHDMQKKIDEMYADWKSVGFSSNMGKDNKWIKNAIGQSIYCIIEKVKYPNDEHIMEVCYDLLLDMYREAFQNKIKNNGWQYFFNKHQAQRFAHQVLSNIVQCIKNTIHSEFLDLTKPKTENQQVSHDKEHKFKDANITRECYMKLNKPVDINNNLHYTYFNLIIDCAFTDPATEKNSITFGIVVALNYLDPTKKVNMVPSEVVEWMNYFLEKMQVNESEEYK
ncbi:27502_t:CDS:2 [Gigaspora margarita]|uniref:27502_t:CDS:1 n=1 Tax=Gigaspora margarita TaxID=4874 RepID=A0ABN7VD63_GIGMA|nr:27502_t:CDS:2 [Gigaspora margarita]